MLDNDSSDQIIGTELDRESIMVHAFPASWTTNGVGTDFNDDLSKQDKGFVSSAQMYPRGSAPLPELPILSGLRASITLQPGTYSVQVRHYSPTSTGPYRIWVAG